MSLPFTAIKLLDASGRLRLVSQQLSTTRQEYRVQTQEPTRAELATLAYPGWTASIDGRKSGLAVVPELGTMSIEIPTGEHTLTLMLEPTPVRHWSSWFSLLLAFCTIAGVCMPALQARVSAGRWRRGLREHTPTTRSGIFVSGAAQVAAGEPDTARSEEAQFGGH